MKHLDWSLIFRRHSHVWKYISCVILFITRCGQKDSYNQNTKVYLTGSNNSSFPSLFHEAEVRVFRKLKSHRNFISWFQKRREHPNLKFASQMASPLKMLTMCFGAGESAKYKKLYSIFWRSLFNECSALPDSITCLARVFIFVFLLFG